MFFLSFIPRLPVSDRPWTFDAPERDERTETRLHCPDNARGGGTRVTGVGTTWHLCVSRCSFLPRNLGPFSCVDWTFSRLFLKDSLPEAKWAKKCQRSPKSLWVRKDADHSQPCVHTGTISACMRSGARPSWTNPIKPIHYWLWQGRSFNAASPATAQIPTPKPYMDRLVCSLNSVYLIFYW